MLCLVLPNSDMTIIEYITKGRWKICEVCFPYPHCYRLYRERWFWHWEMPSEYEYKMLEDAQDKQRQLNRW